MPRLRAVHYRQRLAPGLGRGFTLIEMLISLAILSIVMMVALPSYQNYQDKVLLAQCKADLNEIAMRLEKFKAFNYAYPEYLSDLGNVSKDPWGNDYHYLNLADVNPKSGKVQTGEKGPKPSARKKKNLKPLNSDFDLFSAGKDGSYKPNVSAPNSLDDCIRADDGAFIGLAGDY